MEFFDADAVNRLLTFPVVMDALEEAHRRPPIQIADSFMGDEDGNYFVRSAVDPGRFACTKMVTGTPRNLYEGDLPAVQAVVANEVPMTFAAVSNRTYAVLMSDRADGGGKHLADVAARATNHVETVSDPAPVSGRLYRLATPTAP